MKNRKEEKKVKKNRKEEKDRVRKTNSLIVPGREKDLKNKLIN